MPIQQQQRNQHFAYVLPNKMIAICTTASNFLVCQPHGGYNDYTQTLDQIPFAAISSNATPVLVKARPENQWKAITRTRSAHSINRIRLSHTATFDDYVHSLASWEVDLLSQRELLVNHHSFCDALTQGLRAVSDGSVQH
jgi:hypothetical protein